MDRASAPNRRGRGPPLPPLAYHKYDKVTAPVTPSSYPQIDPRAPPHHLPTPQLFPATSGSAHGQPPYSHPKPRAPTSFPPNAPYVTQPKTNYSGTSSTVPLFDPHFSMNYPPTAKNYRTKSQYLPTMPPSSSQYQPRAQYAGSSQPITHLSHESKPYYPEYNVSRAQESVNGNGLTHALRQEFSFNENVRNVPVPHSSSSMRSAPVPIFDPIMRSVSSCRPIDSYSRPSEPIVWRGTLVLHHEGRLKNVQCDGRRGTLEGRKELDRVVRQFPRELTIQPATMGFLENVDHILSDDSVMWYLRFTPTASIHSKVFGEVTSEIQDERLVTLTQLPELGATLAIFACMEDEVSGIKLIAVYIPFLVDAFNPGGELRSHLPRVIPTPLARKHGPAPISGCHSFKQDAPVPEIWHGSLSVVGKNRQLNMASVAYPLDGTSINDEFFEWPSILMCRWHTCVASSEVPGGTRWCAMFRSEDARFARVVSSLLANNRAMVVTVTNGVLYLIGRKSNNDIVGRLLTTASASRSPRAQVSPFGAVGSRI